jgi:hypothetical protein
MTPRIDAHPGRRLDRRLKVSLVAVGLTGAALALGALLPLGAPFGATAAFSVAVGAALATGNLWALAHIVASLLPRPTPSERGPAELPNSQSSAEGGAGPWALVGALKMLGLVAVVWVLMHHRIVSPLPLLVGFAALPIGIAIGSLVSDRGAVLEDV